MARKAKGKDKGALNRRAKILSEVLMRDPYVPRGFYRVIRDGGLYRVCFSRHEDFSPVAWARVKNDSRPALYMAAELAAMHYDEAFPKVTA